MFSEILKYYLLYLLPAMLFTLTFQVIALSRNGIEKESNFYKLSGVLFMISLFVLYLIHINAEVLTDRYLQNWVIIESMAVSAVFICSLFIKSMINKITIYYVINLVLVVSFYLLAAIGSVYSSMKGFK